MPFIVTKIKSALAPLYNYPIRGKGLSINKIESKSALFKFDKTVKKGQKSKVVHKGHIGGKVPLFLDKVVLTFPCSDPNHKGAVHTYMDGLLKDASNLDKHLYLDKNSPLSKYYAFNYAYITPTKNIVYVSYKPRDPTKNYLRIQFNVKKLVDDGEFAYLSGLINGLFAYHDIEWDGVQVSRLEAALDVPFARELVHITASGYSVIHTHNGVNNYVQTEYVGAQESKLTFCVYDKNVERQKKLGTEYVPTEKKLTRIETRLKSMTIKELKEATPFKKAQVYVLPEHPEITNFVIAWFLDSVKIRGVTAVLAMIPTDHERKKYKGILEQSRAEFWDQDRLQEQYLKELDNLITSLNTK